MKPGTIIRSRKHDLGLFKVLCSLPDGRLEARAIEQDGYETPVIWRPRREEVERVKKAKERVILSGEMELEKGEGHRGFMNSLDISLLTQGGKFTPGVYRVEITRVGPLSCGTTSEDNDD